MNLLSYKLISFKSVPLKMCATQRGGGEQSCDLQSRIFNHYSLQCFGFPSQASVESEVYFSVSGQELSAFSVLLSLLTLLCLQGRREGLKV